MGKASDWLREERRKVLGDWTAICLRCGAARRWFEEFEAEVAAELTNRFPFDLETRQYFTCVYGVLDARSGEFRYVCAGHPGPVHLPHGKPPVRHQPAGRPIGIVPASDTGAVEMGLWSLLGPLPVDLFAWESFGEDWVTDTVNQLKLNDANVYKAGYGALPDLKQANPKQDVVFLWNGTTSGVRVPNGDWIADEANQDVAKRFLKASFRGWMYCRDNPDDCVQIVLDNGPTLGEGHQAWQMNEVNALIWPNTLGIGVMDPASFDLTNQIATDYKIIKKPATSDAYRTDLAEAALAELEDEDTTGEDWEKPTVEVTPGGE